MISLRGLSRLGVPVMLLSTLPAAAQDTPFTLEYAVQTALEHSPTLASGRAAVDRARGSRLVRDGRFDWALDSAVGLSREYTPLAPEIAQRDTLLTARLGVFKRFEWGLEVTPSVQLQTIDSGIQGVGSATVAARNAAVLNVRLTQPLLRGFGAAAVAERDAAWELERAAGADLRQFVAERVLVIAQTYWRYVSSTQTVVVFREAELRAEQLLAQTQQLVAGDERPKADLGQVQANLADRVRDRILAEQAVIDVRSSLGLEMGLDADQIAALGGPLTPFPAVPEAAEPPPVARMVDEALSSRHDLKSAALRLSAAQLLLDGAYDAELPDLSLTVDVGYGGVLLGDEVGDFFGSIASNIPGLNLSVLLALRWPIASSETEGTVLVASAQVADARIQREDLERRIRANLDVSASSVRTSAAAVRRSTEATAFHRTAVSNEQARMKSGLGTLIDVILSSDRLTSAVLAQLNAQERYASALARLSFEAGQLGQPADQGATVVLEALTSPPR